MEDQEPQYLIEKVRKSSVWSNDVLFELEEDDAHVAISLTQGRQKITLRLTLQQWREIRATWGNESPPPELPPRA